MQYASECREFLIIKGLIQATWTSENIPYTKSNYERPHLGETYRPGVVVHEHAAGGMVHIITDGGVQYVTVELLWIRTTPTRSVIIKHLI